MPKETLPIIKKKRINNEIVKPLKVNIDKRPVKGAEIDAQCYNNVLMVAPTNSGKTTALFHMLMKCAGKNTTIIAFVSTLYNDRTWLAIRKYFKSKGITLLSYTSTVEEDVNHLQDLVQYLQQQAEEREKDSDEKEDEEEEKPDLMELLCQTNGVTNYLSRPQEEEETEPKKKRSKYLSPEYILVFDDIAEELKAKVYSELLKRSRHFLIKTITSSQYLKDIGPSTRNQIRLWLIFRGQSMEKLKEIWEALEAPISLGVFVSMYKNAMKPSKECPKPFFYASKDGDYRQCYSVKYIVPEEDS